MALTRTHRIAAAGALLALLGAYFGYTAYQKHSQTRAISALVADTGARLGAAISIDTDPGAPEAAATQDTLDRHAETAARHLAELRGLGAGRVRALADASDEYLNTAVEILRRKAACHGLRMQLLLSTAALRDHMSTNNRSGPWITEAIRAKERMDQDFREYRRTADALAQLLGGYSTSRRRLAAHLDPRLLPEDGAIEAARSRTLAALKQASEEVGKAGRLDAYR